SCTRALRVSVKRYGAPSSAVRSRKNNSSSSCTTSAADMRPSTSMLNLLGWSPCHLAHLREIHRVHEPFFVRACVVLIPVWTCREVVRAGATLIRSKLHLLREQVVQPLRPLRRLPVDRRAHAYASSWSCTRKCSAISHSTTSPTLNTPFGFFTIGARHRIGASPGQWHVGRLHSHATQRVSVLRTSHSSCVRPRRAYTGPACTTT